MAWKMTDNGSIATIDGNPVWLGEDGDEKAVDYAAMSKALRDANRESAGRKAELKKQSETLAWSDGIEEASALSLREGESMLSPWRTLT